MPATSSMPATKVERPIAVQTRGKAHGPITRLVSPSDIGQLIKPFIFLDLFDAPADAFGGFGMHPHSGIATLTVLLQGATRYEDSTGKSGVLPQGGIEWMMAGGGVWHSGAPLPGQHNRGFQLWLAMPPELENAVPLSQYVAPTEIEQEGPAKVLLGQWGDARSRISHPASINYLSVTLAAGEHWHYQPPPGHEVAWMAVHAGALQSPGNIGSGELAVFSPGNGAIDCHSAHGCGFVLGSAVRHPHELVSGSYSVHTSHSSLAMGEAEIRRIGQELRAAGRPG